jgi:hypothetical protein
MSFIPTAYEVYRFCTGILRYCTPCRGGNSGAHFEKMFDPPVNIISILPDKTTAKNCPILSMARFIPCS